MTQFDPEFLRLIDGEKRSLATRKSWELDSRSEKQELRSRNLNEAARIIDLARSGIVGRGARNRVDNLPAGGAGPEFKVVSAEFPSSDKLLGNIARWVDEYGVTAWKRGDADTPDFNVGPISPLKVAGGLSVFEHSLARLAAEVTE